MKKALSILGYFMMTGSLFADLTFVQKVQSTSVMGQPPRDGIMTTYIKGSKAKFENMGPSISEIVDIDSGKIFLINSAQKSVTVMTEAMMKQYTEMASKSGALGSTTAEKLGNAKTVNGYSCEEYKVTSSGMLSSETVACISREIDTTDIDKFREFSKDLAKQFGGMPDDVKGYPVMTDTKITLMGKIVTSHTELVSISNDSIPDSVFVIPADYKTTEMPMLPKPK